MAEHEKSDELVSRLIRRDQSALSEAKKSYGALMRRIAANLCLDRSDAEECENDALFDLWNTVPPERPESLRSYLCMLMRRRVIDRIRYNASLKRAHAAFSEVTEELCDGLDTENSLVDGVCFSEVLALFLCRQTPCNREIFIRRYWEFEDISSIARDLLMSRNALEKRLARMKKELSKMLYEWGYNEYE